MEKITSDEAFTNAAEAIKQAAENWRSSESAVSLQVADRWIALARSLADFQR